MNPSKEFLSQIPTFRPDVSLDTSIDTEAETEVEETGDEPTWFSNFRFGVRSKVANEVATTSAKNLREE